MSVTRFPAPSSGSSPSGGGRLAAGQLGGGHALFERDETPLPSLASLNRDSPLRGEKRKESTRFPFLGSDSSPSGGGRLAAGQLRLAVGRLGHGNF
jgi:hypothetical protein